MGESAKFQRQRAKHKRVLRNEPAKHEAPVFPLFQTLSILFGHFHKHSRHVAIHRIAVGLIEAFGLASYVVFAHSA